MRTNDGSNIRVWLLSVGIPVGACALALLSGVPGRNLSDQPPVTQAASFSLPMIDDAILLSAAAEALRSPQAPAPVAGARRVVESIASVADGGADPVIATFEALDPVGAGHDTSR